MSDRAIETSAKDVAAKMITIFVFVTLCGEASKKKDV